MKKIHVFILCCFSVLLHACSENSIDTEPAVKDNPVTTVFNFKIDQPADLQPVTGTRSDASINESTAEDTTIKDINLFIWDPNDISSLQLIYQDNAENAVVALAPGKYQIRIIANVGYKLDISIFKDFPGILDYFHDDNLQRPDTKYNIFAAAKEIEIRPGQPQTEEIELVRLFARIYLEVSLDDNLTNLTLHSAQVCNIPSCVALFGPPDNSDNYPEAGQCYEKSHVKAATENKISDVVYVYENVKPANLNITDQTQRNTDNAPDGATYVHIIAYETGSTKAYSYYVYLGQNNTTDFSVRRNTSTQYNIVIKGVNEVDLRVQKVFATVVHYGDIHTDLKTWPITEANSFCEIGRYTVSGIKAEDEGKCFAKTPAEYYSFDYGKTWQANDNTTPIPMVSNGKARTIQLRKIVTGPGARPVEPIEFLYGDPEAPTPIKLVTYPPTRYCEYKIKFQIDGLDNYSDFRIKTFSYNSTYGTVGIGSYSTTGQFMLVAFPLVPDSSFDAIRLAFSWKSGYKFLGFQDEQGNIFNCGTTSGTSWSSSPGLYSTLFWREHNQGSGYIYLKFEKETPPEPVKPVVIATTENNQNQTYMLNRSTITVKDPESRPALDITLECAEGNGVFLRDATFDTTEQAWSGTEEAARLVYSQSAATGEVRIPAVFVPLKSGAIPYTITVSDGKGTVLATKTVTNTITKKNCTWKAYFGTDPDCYKTYEEGRRSGSYYEDVNICLQITINTPLDYVGAGFDVIAPVAFDFITGLNGSLQGMYPPDPPATPLVYGKTNPLETTLTLNIKNKDQKIRIYPIRGGWGDRDAGSVSWCKDYYYYEDEQYETYSWEVSITDGIDFKATKLDLQFPDNPQLNLTINKVPSTI